MPHRVIHLHPAAPAKPAVGAACNGCGVCCAAGPCPLGAVASRRLAGACTALLWHEAESRYRCGLIAEPAAFVPGWLRAATPVLAPALAALAHRSVAAGAGCDCDWTPDGA